MLARLGIRQKLALLLTIPLAALLLVMAPFTAERIRDAQSAQTTSRIALAAREVGALIQALQHERLLAMGYLSSPNLDRSALVAQSELASDTAARLAADPLTADVMARAENELAALVALRQFVVSRAVGARRAYEQYGAATTALLDALRLAQPPGADPEGLAQLAALDALMRSNEEVTGTGATLVALVGGLDVDRSLLATTLVRQGVHIAAFGQLVTPEQAGFVDSVDSGQAGVRFYDLVAQVQQAQMQQAQTQTVDDPPVEVSEALTAALSYTGLRRFAQDRTAREIAIAAEQRASAAVSTAVGAVAGAVVVFAVVLALGITVSRSISRPLRRLTRSAAIVSDVAHSELVRVTDSDSPETVPPPRLAAIEVGSRDEIGELAAALNRVQATAAMLIERQVTARANIAVMFANIARRTQNLVGRQLALIDDLERNERNPVMLQRLFRLDHVATRLRRSADSLLVVSGTIDQVISGGPTPLVDVIRSAVAEIEGYRAVRLGQIADIAVVAAVAGDLRLLLAELIENATNFSPPGSPVHVTAELGEECHIRVIDRGLGMSPARLAEENRRLVERERLDVAPTTVLGLFVVGRLARRHGLSVSLEPTAERGITANVRVPARLLTAVREGAPGLAPVRLRTLPPELQAMEAIEEASRTPFPWFKQDGLVAIEAGPGQGESGQAEAGQPGAGQGGPGQGGAGQGGAGQGTVTEPSPAPQPLPSQTPASAVGRASVTTVSPPQSAGRPPVVAGGEEPVTGALTAAGLVRRVPGTNLVSAMGTAPEPPTERLARDPDAEREAINDYLSGLARGAQAAEPDQQTPTSRYAERHS